MTQQAYQQHYFERMLLCTIVLTIVWVIICACCLTLYHESVQLRDPLRASWASRDTLMHAAGLLTYRSFVRPSHLEGSDLRDNEHRIANHSSGSVQDSHLLPFTECGAKVLQKMHIRKQSEHFFEK